LNSNDEGKEIASSFALCIALALNKIWYELLKISLLVISNCPPARAKAGENWGTMVSAVVEFSVIRF